MIEIGKKHTLEIIKELDFGVYLDGEGQEILMPLRYVPEGSNIGDEIEAFVYLDSEDRIIATTEEPYVQVGQCAHLTVESVSDFGAFLKWGVTKDLLVPFKEQRIPMHEGRQYVVYVYIDSSNRIAASSKIDRFLKETDEDGFFVSGQLVDIQIASRSDLGYKVVINEEYIGVIHNNDALTKLYVGDKKQAYIKKIREDKKIDVILQMQGVEGLDSLSNKIIEFLEAEDGVMNITDKSSPEEIYKIFNVSKSQYKKTLGKLYKENKIIVDKDIIRLL